MKKIILFLVLFLGINSYSQTIYVASGLSISSGEDFSSNSYISSEIGMMYENISISTVIGTNNLSTVSFQETWYELKTSVLIPMNYVDVYGLAGVGKYVSNGNTFIEYGAGVSKSFTGWGIFVQVSNWDNKNYITPGIIIE